MGPHVDMHKLLTIKANMNTYRRSVWTLLGKKKQDWQSLAMWAQVVVDICLPRWLEPQWNLIRIDGVT